MRFGIAILRAVIGGLFIGHGLQKLTGAFGGHGLEGTGGFFESLGLYPGKHHATAAGLSEAGGGALMVAGLATPAATAAITGTMTVATLSEYHAHGLGEASHPFELALLFATLIFIGPGKYSVDKS